MVITAKDLSDHAPESHWRVSNPQSIGSELYAVERVKYDKKTNLYQFRSSYYEYEPNQNTRLFSKDFLSNSVAIFSYLSGDLNVLIPRLMIAVENANCAALFLPTSNSTRKLENRTVDKDAAKILNTLIPNKVKKSSVEINVKPVIPIHIHISKKCPYYESFQDIICE